MNFSKIKKLLHSIKVIHTNGSTNSYFKIVSEDGNTQYNIWNSEVDGNLSYNGEYIYSLEAANYTISINNLGRANETCIINYNYSNEEVKYISSEELIDGKYVNIDKLPTSQMSTNSVVLKLTDDKSF